MKRKTKNINSALPARFTDIEAILECDCGGPIFHDFSIRHTMESINSIHVCEECDKRILLCFKSEHGKVTLEIKFEE